MVAPETAYLVMLTVAALISASFAGYAWHRRKTLGARYVALFMFAATIWSVGDIGVVLAPSFDASVAWQVFLWVGVVVEVPAWFLFVLVYTGRGELITRRTLGLIVAVPVLTIAGVATNSLHELVFVNLRPATNAFGHSFEFGPLLWLHTVYAYLLLGIGGVLLLERYHRGQRYYRRQVALILVGALAPAVASLLFVADVTALDFTPAGYVISGVVLSIAISRAGLMDIVPVARDAVIDTIDAAVFVLDRRDRFLDSNPRGRELLEVQGPIVGRPVSDFADIHEHYCDLLEAGEDAETELEVDGSVYTLRVSPLYDHRDRLLARVILVSDISDQKRRERELARRNEQLDRFASVVSHDLRNPLTVARGCEYMLRQSADEEHLERLENAHARMEAIIEDVLAVARSGEAVTDPESVALSSVSEDAWSTVETATATLRVDTDRTVRADPSRLRQMLENLFRNAVEHGTTGKQPSAADVDEQGSLGRDDPRHDAIEDGDDGVTVEVGSLDGGFYVADDGPGVPPEERESIFEDGYTTAEEGTGFGLTIVSEIAEAHGWELSLTESEAGGARFEITSVEGA